MPQDFKEVTSAAAIILTFAIFAPYIVSIVRGQIQPHAFSWLIWAIGTFIVYFAQVADNAGIGAMPIGISACITSMIAILAFAKRSDTSITTVDWGFLAAALSALPFWFLTQDPLWAVVILTLSDLIGFGPTVRNAYQYPHTESLQFFALGSIRNLLVVLALENYSVTTVLFPAAVGVACVGVAVFLYIRRQQVTAKIATPHDT